MSAVDLGAARRAAGLSQRKLGELLGVAQNTISSWELGRSAIPDDRRGALALRLGVPEHAVPARAPVAPLLESRASARCGTPSGRIRHVRMGEEVCAACREAARAYKASRYVPSPREPAECGTNRGYHAHRYRDEDACVACRVAHADYERERAAAR